ncbi:MAG: YoaK family protein [Patulibacter minatonensis]
MTAARRSAADPEVAWATIKQSERRRLLAPTLLLLTFATGVIDALSYLAIGSVFTANMTGNLVLIGFAVGGQPGFSAPRTIVSLLAFMLGALLAGRLAKRWHHRPFLWMQRVTRMELGFLLVAALIATGIHTGTTTPDSPLRYLAVIVLGTAMGVRNATVRRLGFRDLPTTVATSTISDLASESTLGGGERRNQLRRVLAIACMLLGAALGAALVREASVLAAFALAVAAVLAALGHQAWIGHRHPGPAHAVQP